jgi:hypothetical protein
MIKILFRLLILRQADREAFRAINAT